MGETSEDKDLILIGTTCLQRKTIQKLQMKKQFLSNLYMIELYHKQIRNHYTKCLYITEAMCKSCASKCLGICAMICKDTQSDGILLSRELVEIEINCKDKHINTGFNTNPIYVALLIVIIITQMLRLL